MIASRRRLVLPLAVLALSGAATSSFAAVGDTDQATLTAAITPAGLGATGTRLITSVGAVTFANLTSNPSDGTMTTSGTFATTVTEAAMQGSTAWTLTAQASNLASGANSITADRLVVSGRSVLQVAGGGTAAAPGGSGTLDSAQTLISNAQSASALYTGTYASNSTIGLTIPSGQATGTYTGTLTLTVNQ